MSTNAYALIGWLAWKLGSRVAKRRMAQRRVKLGVAVIGLVLIGGVAAARAAIED